MVFKRVRPQRPASEQVIDVYARLSRAANGETIQVDDQAEMGQEAIEDRGAVLGEIFKDNSKSAWNPLVVRPEWELLMGRLESGESDGVWVYDLTRFSRKILEGERLLELAAQGTRILAHSGEYNLSTADGRAQFREAMVAAVRESDKISERSARGHLRRARRGRSHGGVRGYGLHGWLPAPEGWEPGDLRDRASDEQVNFERTVIRDCYDTLFASENTLAGLARDLNSRAIRTSIGGTWSRVTLRQMLSRATVAGIMEHRGEMLGKLVGVEPIVSEEELLRMRALFESRKRGRPPMMGKYLLTGLLICTDCNLTMNGSERTMKPYADGSPAREYRCRKFHEAKGCGRNFIDALTAERIVAEAVKTRLGDPRRAERISQRLAELKGDRSAIESEIASLGESADSLAMKTAEWGYKRVSLAMDPITARIKELTARLAAMDAPETIDDAANDAISTWDEAERIGDAATQRAMIKRAFPRLAIVPRRYYGDHKAERFDWDGQLIKTTS